MRAVWDSGLPIDTVEQQSLFLQSAAETGFDTVIVKQVDESFRSRANDAGLQAIQILTPYVDEAFEGAHPECLQRVNAMEDAFGNLVTSYPWSDQTDRAFRWFPHVNVGRWLCLRHDRSRQVMRERIESALETADGIALDGVGYLNHYACHCDACAAVRGRVAPDGERELDTLARISEEHLVEVSEFITGHAKTVKPECIVTNHLWPPFRPNWYHGSRLKMDYCCQTISWYHRPVWSLSRSRFEAEEHKRLEDPERNTFVPFIAVYHHAESVRMAEQIRQEVEIGLNASGGHLCFSTLETIQRHPDIAVAVRELLSKEP